MSNLRSLLGTQSTSVTGIYSGGVGRLRPGETYYFYQLGHAKLVLILNVPGVMTATPQMPEVELV